MSFFTFTTNSIKNDPVPCHQGGYFRRIVLVAWMGLHGSDEWEKKEQMRSFMTYDIKDIQKVYRRHHSHCGTVLYSDDTGSTWHSVGMDSGKWNILEWKFAFIELEPFANESVKHANGELLRMMRENIAKSWEKLP